MSSIQIELSIGKVEDLEVNFGLDYQEIEEVEDFFKACDKSLLEVEVKSTLEQNQIQFLTVDRKKESKKKTKKKKKVEKTDLILQKYGIVNEVMDEEEEEEEEVSAPKIFGEIISRKLRINMFYFNRQMFKVFGSLDEITQFILSKKDQNAKNMLLLEDIKDLFIAQHIRQAISLTQNAPQLETGVEFFPRQDIPNNNELMRENSLNNPQNENSNGELCGKDSDIQDWLCEIGIKYDIDYKFTFSRSETNEYLVQCLSATAKAKYKKDIGMHEQKSKQGTSELANAEGLDGFYDQQWVGMLMSINQVSEKKAVAIAKQYRTIKSLMLHYQESTPKERELLLQNIQYQGEKGKSQKSIGKCVSKKIHAVFGCEDPEMLFNL